MDSSDSEIEFVGVVHPTATQPSNLDSDVQFIKIVPAPAVDNSTQEVDSDSDVMILDVVPAAVVDNSSEATDSESETDSIMDVVYATIDDDITHPRNSAGLEITEFFNSNILDILKTSKPNIEIDDEALTVLNKVVELTIKKFAKAACDHASSNAVEYDDFALAVQNNNSRLFAAIRAAVPQRSTFGEAKRLKETEASINDAE